MYTVQLHISFPRFYFFNRMATCAPYVWLTLTKEFPPPGSASVFTLSTRGVQQHFVLASFCSSTQNTESVQVNISEFRFPVLKAHLLYVSKRQRTPGFGFSTTFLCGWFWHVPDSCLAAERETHELKKPAWEHAFYGPAEEVSCFVIRFSAKNIIEREIGARRKTILY